MSSFNDNQKKFEIIKFLWSNVNIRKKLSATFEEISKGTGLSEQDVSGFVRILQNAGLVDSTYVALGNFHMASLDTKSFSSMEKSPTPTSYDELLNQH